tara:strand:- start:473 stop:688 length:216 start_codon:yes stop_codon:yes gene_type:complete
MSAADKYWRKGGTPNEDIIKIGYKKNIATDYDVIVVGSGLGGLSAACILAKEGGCSRREERREERRKEDCS